MSCGGNLGTETMRLGLLLSESYKLLGVHCTGLLVPSLGRLLDLSLLKFNTHTAKPPIKDTLREDKPPNRGHAESMLAYILYRKSPLKEDNLSTKDKMAGPKSVLY